MRFIITGRNIDVTEGLRSAVVFCSRDRNQRNTQCRKGETKN